MRHLRLVDRPTPQVGLVVSSPTSSVSPLLLEAGRLLLVLDLIVYASAEINPLFPSNRFVVEACRIVTVDRQGLGDKQLKIDCLQSCGGELCVEAASAAL